VAGAGDEVVVHHAGRLHEGVADRRADEFEAALEQVLAHRVALRRARRDFGHSAAPIHDRAAADKGPEVAIERAELLLHGEKGLRVRDCGGDLQAVAHDTRVGEEARDLAGVVTRDLPGVEIIEGAAVVFALVQDCGPTEPGLGALEDEELEQRAVVMQGHAPFGVVVGEIRLGVSPGATVIHGGEGRTVTEAADNVMSGERGQTKAG